MKTINSGKSTVLQMRREWIVHTKPCSNWLTKMQRPCSHTLSMIFTPVVLRRAIFDGSIIHLGRWGSTKFFVYRDTVCLNLLYENGVAPLSSAKSSPRSLSLPPKENQIRKMSSLSLKAYTQKNCCLTS